MARGTRIARRPQGGAGVANGIAALALLVGLILLPALVHFSAPKVFALWDPTARQLVLASALVGLAALTAGLGLSMRDDPFAILSAGRNRYSLSRLQMALWSWLILSAVIAVAICRAWGFGGAAPGTALLVQLDTNLLAVMGLSYFTAAATPGLLSLKSGGPDQPIAPLVNRPNEEPLGVYGQLVYRPSNFKARLIDLIDGDEASNRGSIDLSKLQQLIITLTLVAVYAVMLFQMFGGGDFVISATGAEKGFTKLPPFSTALLELLAVSHAGYLGYNAVTKPPAAPSSGLVDDGPPPTPARIAEL